MRSWRYMPVALTQEVIQKGRYVNLPNYFREPFNWESISSCALVNDACDKFHNFPTTKKMFIEFMDDTGLPTPDTNKKMVLTNVALKIKSQDDLNNVNIFGNYVTNILCKGKRNYFYHLFPNGLKADKIWKSLKYFKSNFHKCSKTPPWAKILNKTPPWARSLLEHLIIIMLTW